MSVQRPVFILSFRQRDELATLAADDDRPVVATRRSADAARRFVGCGAAVAIVDLRGAWDDGAAVLTELAEPARTRGAALLVLVSRGDVTRLDALREAGATHFLASPFHEDEFGQALRFAEASAERRRHPRVAEAPEPALRRFLGRDLTRALADDEIELLFQPQVAAATGVVVGVEALMRWRHETLGELGAERLLDAADRAGLGAALSAHVHQRALAAASAWPASLATLRLSINVTAEDLADPAFADALVHKVAASGFPPGRLTLEITERGLIEDPAGAAAALGLLRAAGMRIAIDDFGTGYSSLAYLSQLPLDYLKLDRALTQDIVGSARDRTLVTGVIDLAAALGLSVIAEGVETVQQRDLLTRAGATQLQGFLFAAPLDGAALAQFVDGAAAA